MFISQKEWLKFFKFLICLSVICKTSFGWFGHNSPHYYNWKIYFSKLVIFLTHIGSTVHNLITHPYLAVATKYQYSKYVWNRKTVCKSKNTIQNVYVSNKIENVSVSHEIVIYKVFQRGADRGVLTMVCDGPNWCPVDYM